MYIIYSSTIVSLPLAQLSAFIFIGFGGGNKGKIQYITFRNTEIAFPSFSTAPNLMNSLVHFFPSHIKSIFSLRIFFVTFTVSNGRKKDCSLFLFCTMLAIATLNSPFIYLFGGG